MPKVHIADSQIVLEVQEGDILYNALDDQGVRLPHGCLSGSCGACSIEVIDGQKNLQPPTQVEADTIWAVKSERGLMNKDIRLSCRAKIIGNVIIKKLT